MPDDLKTLIDTYYSTCGYFTSHLYNAGSQIFAAHEQAEAQNWAGLALALEQASIEFQDAALHFTTQLPSLRNDMRTVLYWINNNWPSGAEVTMDTILNAMLKASFDNLRQFIGIEDAYRVALWNAPFNADFYAALARGFTVWL